MTSIISARTQAMFSPWSRVRALIDPLDFAGAARAARPEVSADDALFPVPAKVELDDWMDEAHGSGIPPDAKCRPARRA